MDRRKRFAMALQSRSIFQFFAFVACTIFFRLRGISPLMLNSWKKILLGRFFRSEFLSILVALLVFYADLANFFFNLLLCWTILEIAFCVVVLNFWLVFACIGTIFEF